MMTLIEIKAYYFQYWCFPNNDKDEVEETETTRWEPVQVCMFFNSKLNMSVQSPFGDYVALAIP